MTPEQQTHAPYDPAAEVVDFSSELIGIDTTNAGDGAGPGERKAAEYVAERPGTSASRPPCSSGPAAGRTCWPAGEGADPDLPPLLLHGHLDVVPAEADDWRFPPFAGEIDGGYVHGRGAIDMKDFDAMILSVLRARVRAEAPPRRPVSTARLRRCIEGMTPCWDVWDDGCRGPPSRSVGLIEGAITRKRGRRTGNWRLPDALRGGSQIPAMYALGVVGGKASGISTWLPSVAKATPRSGYTSRLESSPVRELRVSAGSPSSRLSAPRSVSSSALRGT